MEPTKEDLRVAREAVRSWGSRLPRSPAGTEIWESKLGSRGIESLVEAIASMRAAEREKAAKGLPICPKCQQGYICEYCGDPIGDYYAEVNKQ